jgi:hypothetical protein
VASARRACELSEWKNPQWIDILAAAYAQNGEFGEAAESEALALKSPDFPSTAVPDARRRLKLYQEQQSE